MVVVASLGATEALVTDVSRVYAVVREDFRGDVSQDAGFMTDTTAVRIKGSVQRRRSNTGKEHAHRDGHALSRRRVCQWR